MQEAVGAELARMEGLRASRPNQRTTWRRAQSISPFPFFYFIIISFLSVLGKRHLAAYRETGAQNDHIIFLIHVVSPPLPSRPLFASRNEGYRSKVCQWVHHTEKFGSLFPAFARLVRSYVLFVSHESLPTTGIFLPTRFTGEDEQRWP